jgi:hypothetical protein
LDGLRHAATIATARGGRGSLLGRPVENDNVAMIAIRGTLICSLVVVVLDVVVDGSYLVSALVCPIWLLIAVVRTIMRPPSFAIGAARILVPVITGLVAFANFSMQGRIAMDNAAHVIQACERYPGINGAYPERLSELVPSYLSSVPRAKYCLLFGEFWYFGSPGHMLLWHELPPFGRRVYPFDNGEWHYLD